MKPTKRTLDTFFEEKELANMVLKEYQARLEEYEEKIEKALAKKRSAKEQIVAAAAEYVLDIVSDPDNEKMSYPKKRDMDGKPSIRYSDMTKKLQKEEPRFTKQDIDRAIRDRLGQKGTVRVVYRTLYAGVYGTLGEEENKILVFANVPWSNYEDTKEEKK